MIAARRGWTRLLRLGAALSLAAAASCGRPGRPCQEFGLAPGTPEFQRCEAARAERESSATRGAVEMIRSIDAMRPGLR
jgi:hypothetical protein